TATVSNSYVRCTNTLLLADRWTSGGSLYGLFGPRTTTLDGNTYVDPANGLSWNIVQLKKGDQGTNANHVAIDTCLLRNYGGHNYQLYWVEQPATSYLDQTTFASNHNPQSDAPVGCPDAFLTNQQSWDKYSSTDTLILASPIT